MNALRLATLLAALGTVSVAHAQTAATLGRPVGPTRQVDPKVPQPGDGGKIFPLNSSWVAVSLNGKPFTGERPSFKLDDQLRATGFSGCNTYATAAYPLREQGLAILMITHDLSTAARFAQRIAVMYLGRIVEEGPAASVVRNPQHPYTKALLSVVPRRDPRDRTRPQILKGETPDAVFIPSGCRFHPRCPIAEERCAVEDPALARPTSAEAGHRAACLLLPGAGDVTTG